MNMDISKDHSYIIMQGIIIYYSIDSSNHNTDISNLEDKYQS